MSAQQPVLSEAELPALLARFYGRVRLDPELGPIFEDAVHDWPAHLARIGDFWSSVLFGSGRYKGNPFGVHQRHAPRLSPALFARWLSLWEETTAEMLAPDAAALLREKAHRIADSLQQGLFFRPEEHGPAGRGRVQAAAPTG